MALEKAWDDTVEQARSNKCHIGYQYIKCRVNFEVKSDFRRKTRFIAGRHMTDPPDMLTYSSVVSREIIRTGFLIVALNGLDVLAGDIGNAYINAPCKEKIWTIVGPGFGIDQGQVMLIVQALYV